MSAFDFEPAFGGNNTVSAGTVSGQATPITAPSGTSGGFNWTNPLKTVADIAAPIATNLIAANQQKAANKAAAKQAEREAARQAEYLRAQLAAQAQNPGNTSGKMPAWLMPVVAVVGVVVLAFVFLGRRAK